MRYLTQIAMIGIALGFLTGAEVRTVSAPNTDKSPGAFSSARLESPTQEIKVEEVALEDPSIAGLSVSEIEHRPAIRQSDPQSRMHEHQHPHLEEKKELSKEGEPPVVHFFHALETLFKVP